MTVTVASVLLVIAVIAEAVAAAAALVAVAWLCALFVHYTITLYRIASLNNRKRNIFIFVIVQFGMKLLTL